MLDLLLRNNPRKQTILENVRLPLSVSQPNPIMHSEPFYTRIFPFYETKSPGYITVVRAAMIRYCCENYLRSILMDEFDQQTSIDLVRSVYECPIRQAGVVYCLLDGLFHSIDIDFYTHCLLGVILPNVDLTT